MACRGPSPFAIAFICASAIIFCQSKEFLSSWKLYDLVHRNAATNVAENFYKTSSSKRVNQKIKKQIVKNLRKIATKTCATTKNQKMFSEKESYRLLIYVVRKIYFNKLRKLFKKSLILQFSQKFNLLYATVT